MAEKNEIFDIKNFIQHRYWKTVMTRAISRVAWREAFQNIEGVYFMPQVTPWQRIKGFWHRLEPPLSAFDTILEVLS